MCPFRLLPFASVRLGMKNSFAFFSCGLGELGSVKGRYTPARRDFTDHRCLDSKPRPTSVELFMLDGGCIGVRDTLVNT